MPLRWFHVCLGHPHVQRGLRSECLSHGLQMVLWHLAVAPHLVRGWKTGVGTWTRRESGVWQGPCAQKPSVVLGELLGCVVEAPGASGMILGVGSAAPVGAP